MSDNSSPSDVSAFRMFESSQFFDGAVYASKAEFYRDMRLPQYRSDPVFREKADSKLKLSMSSNPNFNTSNSSQGVKNATVAISRSKAGDIHAEVADSAGVNKLGTTRDVSNNNEGFNSSGVKAVRDAFGNLTVQARTDMAKPQVVKPQTSGRGGVSIQVNEPSSRR